MGDCCKVGHTIDHYELKQGAVGADINDYLLARWLGQNEYPETALRPLTDWFNQKVLKTVYTKHNRSAIDTRIQADYEALTGDDEITQTAIVDDLEEDGIDGEELKNHFISTTTLYRHFTNCLDAEKEKSDSKEDSNWEMEKLKHAQKSFESNMEDILKSYDNKDVIANATEAKVDHPVLLECPECGKAVRFQRALKRGYICQDHMGGDGDGNDESVSNGSTEEPQPQVN